MSGLLYRKDMDAVRARLTTWWNGGDIGRPVMQIAAPRRKPLEDIPEMPKPDGWVTDYSASNFDYRVNLAQRAFAKYQLFGEAVPAISPHTGAGSVALYLGCQGKETPGTVWFLPCVADPDKARIEYDRDNFYWDFTLRLSRRMVELARGKMVVEFPDLIEGLDILASLRGTEPMLLDLLERPEWVHSALRRITDAYFHYYDMLYDLMRDEVGGSIYWAWAPGRVAKLQCDCSAMISPAQFKEFMLPVLQEMTERLSYSLYHLDGPVCLQHHAALCSLPSLDMIQWTPGAGVEPTWHKRWWPVFHKTFDAGKKLYLHWDGEPTVEDIRVYRREFGPRFKQFLFSMRANSAERARDLLNAAEE